MDYNKQAQDFLKSCGIEMFLEKAVPQSAPRWAKDGKHGTQYSVVLAKMKGEMRPDQYIAGLKEMHNFIEKQIQFFFWNSISAKETAYHSPYGGEKKPSAYDILAGLYFPCDSFKDFCDNLGYSEDSRGALATYQEVVELNAKVESIFTPKQLLALQEIV